MANEITRKTTLDDFIAKVYEDNYSHIDFMDNMGGGDCDCDIHKTMNFIFKELGEEKDE